MREEWRRLDSRHDYSSPAISSRMASNGDNMAQTDIFEDLQRKIDEDTAIKDACYSTMGACSRLLTNLLESA
jgi:hypothetical protein